MRPSLRAGQVTGDPGGRHAWWLALLAFLPLGCGLPQKQFRVTSYPAGATIYVEGEKRGQTDVDKLTIAFPKSLVAVRLEREGYQPVGTLVSVDSPEELFFVLQEAPHSRELSEGLKQVQSLLEALPQRIGDQLKAAR